MNSNQTNPAGIRCLILILAVGLIAMLVVSLVERFKNPQITTVVQPINTDMDSGQASSGVSAHIASLMQEVGKKPDDPDLLVHLADALMQQQNWDAAANFAERAMTIDLKNPQPIYQLGVIRHNQGRHSEAAELLERVVPMEDTASVRYSLGVLYLHFLADSRRAASHLEAGLKDGKASQELLDAIRAELDKAVRSVDSHAVDSKNKVEKTDSASDKPVPGDSAQTKGQAGKKQNSGKE